MKNLIFYSSVNTPGLHDATGAFEPEAKKFAKLHKIPKERVIGIDCIENSKRQRRALVSSAIKQQGKLDCLVFFCHGWSSGVQFGLLFRNVMDLAYLLAHSAPDSLRVLLYCCSTADGPDIGNESYPDDEALGTPAPGTDGGFADMLRDQLCQSELAHCKIIAHRTAGDCTRNPYVVVFEGDGTAEGKTEEAYEGGHWIVDPKDDLWPAWRKALQGDLRFRFPFMSLAEIENELRGEK